MKKVVLIALCLCLCVALLAGCAAAPADTSTLPPETSAPDTSQPETSAPDSSLPDTSTPNTAAPDTSRPENSASQEAAGGETPPAAYRQSAWQQEVAQRQQQWTVAERIDAAVEPYNADDCKALRIQNIYGRYDQLTEEQKALMPAPGDRGFEGEVFLMEDGRLLFASLGWDELSYGQYGGDHIGPRGDLPWEDYDWFLVYEGDIPESGLLDGVRIRDICYAEKGTSPEQILEEERGRQAAMREHFEELAQSETGLQLIGYDEAVDALLRALGWQGFEKTTAPNGAVCYTNGEVFIYPNSGEYEHYWVSMYVGTMWTGTPALNGVSPLMGDIGADGVMSEYSEASCRTIEQKATIDRFIPKE